MAGGGYEPGRASAGAAGDLADCTRGSFPIARRDSVSRQDLGSGICSTGLFATALVRIATLLAKPE